MAWQDVLPLSVTRIDAEQERELRLAAQARAGAEWALAALVARYQPPVTRYLTRLTGDVDLAGMLAERIFLRMERRLRGPHGGHQLRLWLLRACTEAGLDAVRQPRRVSPAQLESPRFAGLLTGRVSDSTANRLRAGWETLTEVTGTTRRQVRKLIWNSTPAPARAGVRTQTLDAEPSGEAESITAQDPREALRYRLIRAVLAELPYGDAQCLALHLVASLNQAEVARALGITQSATRRRIVHGLQLFAQRYEAAAASLGLPPELAAGEEADLIEEGHESADVEAIVADAAALAPSPAVPSQPLPIWSGAYAGPGEEVGLGLPPAELVMRSTSAEPPTSGGTEARAIPVTPDTPQAALMTPAMPLAVEAVTEGIVLKLETIVDAVPFVVTPAWEDRVVILAPEPPPEAMEFTLGREPMLLIVEAAAPAIECDMGISIVRLVPVLTPSTDVARGAVPDALTDETAATDSASSVESASGTPNAGARLVPVLTPGIADSETETTLRAVILNGGLGAFGAASAPTLPLPGRVVRRAEFTIVTPEEQPTAG